MTDARARRSATRRNRRSGYDAPAGAPRHGRGRDRLRHRRSRRSPSSRCSRCTPTACSRSTSTSRAPRCASSTARRPRRRRPSSAAPRSTTTQPSRTFRRTCSIASTAAARPMASAGIQAGRDGRRPRLGRRASTSSSPRKLVGPTGRAIGVDMTDRMLAVARENQPRVAAALGYDVVEFREGFLEQIPVESRSGRPRHLELRGEPLARQAPGASRRSWRVLKDHGRDRHRGHRQRARGAAAPEGQPAALGRVPGRRAHAGGVPRRARARRLLRPRRSSSGATGRRSRAIPFYSVTVRGFKFEKTAGCVFQGHRAVYLGPGQGVRGRGGPPVPAQRALRGLHRHRRQADRGRRTRSMFAILEPGEERASYACCASGAGCC